MVELLPIRREVFTGGEYRKLMIEQADAVVAIGGGKGTYSAGIEMMAQGKPVLPLDLQLGSIVQDGDGADALYRENGVRTQSFLPQHASGIEKQNRAALLGAGNQRCWNRSTGVRRDTGQGVRRSFVIGSAYAHPSASGNHLEGREDAPNSRGRHQDS